MKIILRDILEDEVKDFLLSQEGITKVNLEVTNGNTELDIMHNENTSPELIMKYVELFESSKNSSLIEFDKENNNSSKKLKYTVGDLCCEYCYMNLVRDLYDNKNIKSVKSDFNFKSPALNVGLIVEYDKDYDKDELLDFIDDNIK